MNLQEAINTRKLFRRPTWGWWYYLNIAGSLSSSSDYLNRRITDEDRVANDFEIKNDKLK